MDRAASGPQDATPPDAGAPRKWLILGVVGLGMFMALLDSTIVNIAVPAIIADLKTGVSAVSWVLNAYNLSLAVLLLSVGRVADHYGLRRVFLAGLVVFSVFSLACGLAPQIHLLIGFRVVQALGAAGMIPISLAILLGVFPRSQQGFATAVWGALGAVAAAVGPSLGGILIQYASWHWIFFVNVPIGVVAIIAVLLVVPAQPRTRKAQSIDVVGILLNAAGLFCLTLPLIEGNSWGWGSWRVIALFAASLVAMGGFVLWERFYSSPMLDLRLFRIRSFSAANAGMVLVGTAMGGAIFMLVIFMVIVLGYSELRAALAITPMPVTALILSPPVGRLLNRVPPNVFAVIGAVFFTTGLGLVAGLGGSAHLFDVAWRVVIIGAGIAFTVPTLASAGMSSLPPQQRGVGSGSINTSRQVGFALGVAILVAIFSHTAAADISQAVKESRAYVSSQSQIAVQTRQQILKNLQGAAKQVAMRGGGGNIRTLDPLAGITAPPVGSPEEAALKSVGDRVNAIFKTHLGNAFHWPFFAAALASFLALIPTALLGRRLGQFDLPPV